MRKITSKHESGKKKRRNQFIVGAVLVFIMFFSVIGYSFQGGEDGRKINYNGFEFTEQNGFWILNIGNSDFIFRFNPEEAEKIDSELDYINKYSGQPLYVSSDNNEVKSEIYVNLNKIAQRMQPACLNESKCEENLPIKTCEDNFIIVKESNYTKVIQEGNCVFIEGPQENLTRITDGFLLKILGVQ